VKRELNAPNRELQRKWFALFTAQRQALQNNQKWQRLCASAPIAMGLSMLQQ
jgi:hypothetical protein